MELIEEWHIEIFGPDSPTPDIAQTTLPTWRSTRAYIGAAKVMWPEAMVWVTVPVNAPETVIMELAAMGVGVFRNTTVGEQAE
jgi:hypothetical protein